MPPGGSFSNRTTVVLPVARVSIRDSICANSSNNDVACLPELYDTQVDEENLSFFAGSS